MAQGGQQQPYQNTGGSGQDIMQQAAGNMQMSDDVNNRVAQGGAPAQSMNAYINPYQAQVTDDMTQRMTHQRDMNLNNIQGNAVQGGAFGGSRHGLVEAQAYQDSARDIGMAQNQMAQTGFDKSLSAGFQDVNQQMNAGQNLFGSGQNRFNMGNQMTDRQAANGAMQQNLMQQILGQANNQFEQYNNHGWQQLNNQTSSLAGNPLMGESTTTQNPGLLSQLSTIASVGGSVAGGGKS